MFEHIDKKELFEAFSTEYLSNVQKISNTEYTADIGYRTTGNFDADVKGDIQGSIYIKKDKNDPNHVIGRVKLVEVNSYLEFYDEPNCFGGTTSRANRITLKEGDLVSVKVKNTNKTISQLLRNFFYMVSGNESYQVFAEQTGVVAVNGSTSNK